MVVFTFVLTAWLLVGVPVALVAQWIVGFKAADIPFALGSSFLVIMLFYACFAFGLS